jgi:hypothetical protein
MKLPSYSAEASLGPSSIAYTGAVGSGGRSRRAIVPASVCPPGLNCDAVLVACGFSLGTDPFTCLLYALCCHGAGRAGDPGDVCRNNPCAPGCPPELCYQSGPGDIGGGYPLGLTSADPTLSAGFSDLSSRLESIERQLRGIAKCVCPPPPPPISVSPPPNVFGRPPGVGTVPPMLPRPDWSG